MTTTREQIATRIGAVEEVTVGDPVLEELQRRLQEIAPEIRAGEASALAQQEEIEAEIAAEMKRRELDQLAEREIARRADAEATRKREERRGELTARRDELASKRDERLWAVECALDDLFYAIANWDEAETEHERLRVTLKAMEYEDKGFTDPPRESVGWRATVENRLVFKLKEMGYKDLDFALRGIPVPGQPDRFKPAGFFPIGKPPATSCALCTHEKADEITAAVLAREESGESLRAMSQRFGVSRTTLSRHAAHVLGPVVIE